MMGPLLPRLVVVVTLLVATTTAAAAAVVGAAATPPAPPPPPPDFGPDFVPSTQDNMNGEYVFSSTPGGTPGKFPKRFRDYPGGAESFDVYSPPITTYYSQVWWSPLAPAPLPDAVVQKYAGKGMAIVGWEIDQVRRTPQGDVSVPISASYNHHYVASMIGAKARYRKVMLDGPDDPRVAQVAKGHGMLAWDQPQYLIEELEDAAGAGGMPTHQQFSSANGGEYRKTYHGFTPGHVLVVDSPTAMQITPMQIDTWNRAEMNISGGALPPRFVAGPMPASSLAPEHAEYSGLLECPMTTRITKVLDGTYVAQNAGTCATPIVTFQECFQAAAALLVTAPSSSSSSSSPAGAYPVNRTGSDPTRPPGCSATVDVTHGGGGGAADVTMVTEVFFNELAASRVACAAGGEKNKTLTAVAGATDSVVRVAVELNATTQLATLTLRGPAAVWFGAGFGAHAMADLPWTVVVDGSGAVTERKLGAHAAGSVLAPSVTVLSNRVDGGGVRTVELSRPLRGAGADYYTFQVLAADATIPIITAVGTGPTFGYHKDKAPSTLTLLPVGGGGSCVCPEAPKPFGQASGQLVYHRGHANQSVDLGSGPVGFSAGKCAQWPSTNLIEQRNPTCDIRHYRGGQWSCHHMWSLLDADQEIPWADTPLVFHHKYRFWVQPYNTSYHTPLTLGETAGSALLIGSPWEFDVPKCAAGVAGCSFDAPTNTWIHTVNGSTMGRHTFAALNFHCHAPTCLSMAVYACPKGTPLPACNSTNGKLLCLQRPVYGGSGNAALKGTRFDEPGYIAIPDCFWGDAQFGLEAPLDLDGVPLHMVKTSNATWGHYGEMAGGQPWVFTSP